MMVAHILYECRRICFPISREAFQILEHGGEPRSTKNRNGIFGVLVKIRVEISLIHEVGLTTDVKDDPSQIMQLENCKKRRVFGHPFLNDLAVIADRLLSVRLDLCNDGEAV